MKNTQEFVATAVEHEKIRLRASYFTTVGANMHVGSALSIFVPFFTMGISAAGLALMIGGVSIFTALSVWAREIGLSCLDALEHVR